ncbi:hypothetical protein O71_11509 [Pontibacter sp. BAB1700]|nr:hypothetical protein O71_11509 [Pontibacter sp. BAB1700]
MRNTIVTLLCIPLIGLAVYYLPETKLKDGIEIDRLVVYKSQRKLVAYASGELVKTYTIALGRKPGWTQRV